MLVFDLFELCGDHLQRFKPTFGHQAGSVRSSACGLDRFSAGISYFNVQKY
jgi:hypothetical protein